MPEDGERRIRLWRKGIFLFHKTSEEEGPFFQAGYVDYWCEGISEEGLNPDIFAFSKNFYVACDLSLSSSKGDEMAKYKECTPSEYIKKVLSIDQERKKAGFPFLITDTHGLRKYPGYNLIQVDIPVNIVIDGLDDFSLRIVLERWQGFRTVEPSFQLLAIPESSNEELKKPLAGILKWASGNSEWVSYNKVIENLMGHLYKSFSQKSKGKLKRKVRKIITDLSKSHLKDYLILDGESFKIDMDINNPQSRKGFSHKINEWLDIKPIEVYFGFDDTED